MPQGRGGYYGAKRWGGFATRKACCRWARCPLPVLPAPFALFCTTSLPPPRVQGAR